MNFFLEIKENIIISYKAITANKLRSFLATLGIVIGITSVTLMQTAIEGINRAFEKVFPQLELMFYMFKNLNGLEKRIGHFTGTGKIYQ